MFVTEDKEFKPPDIGLLPDEKVEWTERAGTPFMIIFCGGCLPLSAVFIIPFSYILFGNGIGLGVAFLCLIGILYYVSSFVAIRRTRYYITTKRVIEVRGGFIEKELSRELFSGRPHSEFLQVKEDHRSGATTFVTIRIYDIPSNTLIEMKGQDEDDVDHFKKLGSS